MMTIFTADCGGGDADAVFIDIGTPSASADCDGPCDWTDVEVGFDETTGEDCRRK